MTKKERKKGKKNLVSGTMFEVEGKLVLPAVQYVMRTELPIHSQRRMNQTTLGQ